MAGTFGLLRAFPRLSLVDCIACGKTLGHYGPIINKNEHMTCAITHDAAFAEAVRKGYTEWAVTPVHTHKGGGA